MHSEQLKQYLHQLADNVTPDTKVEDIISQLALLEDLQISERQLAQGDIIPHAEVERKMREWLQ